MASEESQETLAGDVLSPEARSTFRTVVMRATSFRSGGLLLPKDSLYGSVIILPQIARSLGNHPFYVGKAIIAWVCLLLVIVLQSVFVFEVYRMVAQKDECCTMYPDPCLAAGFSQGGPAWFGSMRNRWYLCSPNSEPESRGKVLRKLCVVAFVICLFKDLRQSYEMALLFWKLPNKPGTWMVVVTVMEESIRVDANGHKQLVTEEDNHMEWQVDSMEVYWKVLLVVFVLLPKITIFAFLYFYGSMWLMNVDDHNELILNAVALVFVLELDEAVFSAVTTSDVQQCMDNLQPWNPSDEELVEEWQGPAAEGDDTDASVRAITTNWSWGDIGLNYVANVILGVLTFPVLLLVCSALVIQWYDMHCHYDGTFGADLNAVCAAG